MPCLSVHQWTVLCFHALNTNQEVTELRVRLFFPQLDEKHTFTVSTSQKVKYPTLGDIMCLAHLICWLCPKNKTKKKRTESVCARDCVPEEPDVYENKDMLCWELCGCFTQILRVQAGQISSELQNYAMRKHFLLMTEEICQSCPN